jgi:hypothetical protein
LYDRDTYVGTHGAEPKRREWNIPVASYMNRQQSETEANRELLVDCSEDHLVLKAKRHPYVSGIGSRTCSLCCQGILTDCQADSSLDSDQGM